MREKGVFFMESRILGFVTPLPVHYAAADDLSEFQVGCRTRRLGHQRHLLPIQLYCKATEAL